MIRTFRLLLVFLVLPALAWGQAQVINGNRVHAGWVNYGTTAGTATAYTLTFAPALPGYVQGQCFLLKPHLTNTGAATLNVQAKGALSLTKLSGGLLVPLVAGDLPAGRLMMACHDGTALQLMGTAPDASGPGSGIATMPTAADQVLVSDSTTAGTWQTLPNCPDTGGNHLNYTLATNQWTCGTSGGTVGSIPFSALAGGTNTAAAMVVGTGASLAPTGTGTITATGLSTPLPVTSGGTGAAPSTGDQLLVSDTATAATWRTLPNCPDSGGNHLNYDLSTNLWTCGTSGGVGVVTDAQIPDLNTLSTGLTVARCVRTNNTTGLLEVAAGDCGTTTAAPVDATYWTASPNGTLSAEVNLGQLTTGLLKHTVSGGTSTPATAVVGTDYVDPAGLTTGLGTKQDSVTWGAGLAFAGGTASTASTEAGFLADGGATPLTCGAAQQGKMQVMDDGSLQFCDGATTATLRTVPSTVGDITGVGDCVSGQCDAIGGLIVKPKVQTPSGASITINLDTTRYANIGTVNAATTFLNPTGTAFDREGLSIRVCSATPQTLSWGAEFVAPYGRSLPTATTGGGACDLLGFERDSTLARWNFVTTTQTGGASLSVSEIDGTPSGAFTALKFSNGSMTNNGDGSATIITGVSGGGDVSGPASSVDNELALFSGTGGKTIKRSTTSGVLFGTAGVLSAAIAGTHYVAPGGALGTPSSGVAANLTGLPIVAGTTGTLSAARGGTDVTTPTDDAVLVGNGTAWQSKALPDCEDTAGKHLNYAIATNTWTCGTSSPAGGGISGATANGALYATGATTGTSTPALTDGQLLMGRTGLAPVAGTVGGTTNQIRVTPGAGSLVFDFPPTGVTLPGTTTGSFSGPLAGNASTATALAADLPYAGLTPATAASRLLGRGSTSAGDWQEVTLGTNLSMSGTTLNATGGAGVTDGDKGDITVSGTGATWTIDPTVITYAKIQNVSASARLLGRNTAGTGPIEELTPAIVKSLLGMTFGDLGGIATAAQLPTASGTTTGALTSTDWNTFNGKQAALGFTPENHANLSTDAILGTSNTLYPSQGAVKEYVDNGAKNLTHTAITPRPCVGGPGSPIVLNADNLIGCDFVQIDALNGTTNFDISGIFVNSQWITVQIFTTTQRALTWTSGAGKFANEGIPLPTFTRGNGYVLYGFRYNAHSSRWALAATNQTTNYGTAGYVQTAGGAGVEPSWQPPAGGLAGTTGMIHLPMTAAIPSTAVGAPLNQTPARLDSSGANPRLLFDNATRQCAVWGPLMMNADFNPANTPVFQFQYTMFSTITSGGISITVDVMDVPPGLAFDTNAESYDAMNTCNDAAAPTTIGHMKQISCPLVNRHALVANAMVKFRLCRNFDDATDTAAALLAGLAARIDYVR